MSINLDAPGALDEEATVRPGKVGCAHLPGIVNRLCDSCDALIVAHRVAACAHGHTRMLLPSTAGPVVLWCSDCDEFSEFAA